VKTRTLRWRTPTGAVLETAKRVLDKGELAALPTETVYGLAADALNPQAVVKIFEAKERPRFNPLIVHLPDWEWFEKIVHLRAQDRRLVSELTTHFWPGPLTLVLPHRSIVPDIVTAGLDTLAVRMSAHRAFSSIIRAFGRPLAAPSANRFGHLSPTTAEHVRHELNNRIPVIIDAGPTAHGIESTIVAVKQGKMQLLRRGPITREQLAKFGNVGIASPKGRPIAPGQLRTHYAPRTPLVLVKKAREFVPPRRKKCGLLAWSGSGRMPGFAKIRFLSVRGDLREAAANLFGSLHDLDEAGLDLIVAESVPEQGVGCAILDRLRRAAWRR